MRGKPGTGSRKGNSYYLEFLDLIYKKNQQSPFPAKREVVYNLTQEIWHELEIRFQKEGLEEVFENMRAYYPNGK